MPAPSTKTVSVLCASVLFAASAALGDPIASSRIHVLDGDAIASMGTSRTCGL